MARTPERVVKDKVRKLLGELDCYYVMPVTGGYGTQGAPDFLVCHRGRFIGIETKAGKGRTTTLQELNLSRIRNAGGVALVIYEDDIDRLKKCLYEIEIGE